MSFSATFIFSARDFHSRRIWYEQLAPKVGTKKWNQFMASVTGARVMGIRVEVKKTNTVPVTHNNL